MNRLQSIAAGDFARRRDRGRRAAADRVDHDLHRHRDALCVLLDRRRRRRACRLCTGDRQRVGLFRRAAQPLAHPHRHRLCPRAASDPGRARPHQPRRAGVLLRAGDLACLGRAAAVLRVRLALAVGTRDTRWSSRRRCGSRALRSSSRSHCCCWRGRLLPRLSGNLEALFETIGSKSAVAEAKEEIAAVEQAFEAERKP